VVLQKNQFSWVSPKKLKERTDPEAEYLAIKILSGKYSDPTEGSLFFHAKNVEPFKRKRVKKIGNHIFYR
jgi:spore germination cell wall hydrolase CwlJ-like protein